MLAIYQALSTPLTCIYPPNAVQGETCHCCTHVTDEKTEAKEAKRTSRTQTLNQPPVIYLVTVGMFKKQELFSDHEFKA